ncbi:hypothetical protein [Sulfitobacter aestuariivivens]|uniref:hypothetical protein n=1 Tax=Sulfitobacter aestuariivivens TaxID=2766981 RepID=UPI0036099144
MTRDPVEIISQSQFFDAEWYCAAYPDVVGFRDGPVEHYLHFGGNWAAIRGLHLAPTPISRVIPRLRRRGTIRFGTTSVLVVPNIARRSLRRALLPASIGVFRLPKS